jgi:STE24 endopeptidase
MSPADAAAEALIARIPLAEQAAAAAATQAELVRWLLCWAAVLLVCILVARTGELERLQQKAQIAGRRPWPRGWPVWCGAGAAVGLFALAWMPYALGAGAAKLPPAPVTPASRAVAELIARAGLPADRVRLSAAPGFDADVTGGFGRAFVSLSQGALEAPPAEARAYVAHLAGHWVHHDVLILAMAMAACAFAGGLAVAGWLRPLSRLLGGRDAEPTGLAVLPALAILVSCTVIASTPVLAGFGRWANVRADRYALELTGDPDAYVAMLVHDWDHRAVRPAPLEEALFYSHPPLIQRIHRAMAWKQAR